MKRSMPAALAVLLLVACSPSAVALQPGMWETTVQFTSIDLPGASPQELAAMRAMTSRPQTHSECITPEQAANPVERMINPPGNGNACHFTESVFAGGTIRVHGSCQAPGRGTSAMGMEGSYTTTTMQATISNEVSGMPAPPGTPAAQPQAARMSGTLSARRTGDCPT